MALFYERARHFTTLSRAAEVSYPSATDRCHTFFMVSGFGQPDLFGKLMIES
tara:strand:- start:53 stop:208 length:156 start_codon:yes stop_codon:yes gene_type:complete